MRATERGTATELLLPLLRGEVTIKIEEERGEGGAE